MVWIATHCTTSKKYLPQRNGSTALTGPGRHCRAARNTLVCPWLLPRGNPIVYLSTSWNDRHNILNGCTSWPLSAWVKLRGLSVSPKPEIGVESTSCCFSDKSQWRVYIAKKKVYYRQIDQWYFQISCAKSGVGRWTMTVKFGWNAYTWHNLSWKLIFTVTEECGRFRYIPFSDPYS